MLDIYSNIDLVGSKYGLKIEILTKTIINTGVNKTKIPKKKKKTEKK